MLLRSYSENRNKKFQIQGGATIFRIINYPFTASYFISIICSSIPIFVGHPRFRLFLYFVIFIHNIMSKKTPKMVNNRFYRRVVRTIFEALRPHPHYARALYAHIPHCQSTLNLNRQTDGDTDIQILKLILRAKDKSSNIVDLHNTLYTSYTRCPG